MELIGYELVDGHSGKILGTYSYADRKRARNRAEKLNSKYGAHRYGARPVIGYTAEERAALKRECDRLAKLVYELGSERVREQHRVAVARHIRACMRRAA